MKSGSYIVSEREKEGMQKWIIECSYPSSNTGTRISLQEGTTFLEIVLKEVSRVGGMP